MTSNALSDWQTIRFTRLDELFTIVGPKLIGTAASKSGVKLASTTKRPLFLTGSNATSAHNMNL